MANPQDKWPKYWVPEQAFMISLKAAAALSLQDKPFDKWSYEEKIKAATLTKLEGK